MSERAAVATKAAAPAGPSSVSQPTLERQYGCGQHTLVVECKACSKRKRAPRGSTVRGKGAPTDEKIPNSLEVSQESSERMKGASPSGVRPNFDFSFLPVVTRPEKVRARETSTVWDATFCVNSVNGKTVVAHDCLTYGFSIDSTSKVTTHPPKKTNASAHTSVLASEFPGWTFVTVEKSASP